MAAASAGAATFAVAGADALASGCSAGGAFLVAGRLSVAGIAAGALAGLAMLPTGAPGRLLRLGLAAAVAIPWGIWTGGHLAGTPTLRGRIPEVVLVVASAVAMGLMAYVFLEGLRAIAAGKRGASAMIAGVVAAAGGFVAARLLADLHAPMAMGAIVLAALGLSQPILWAISRAGRRGFVFSSGGMAAIAAAAFAVPVGLEDAFEAADRGSVAQLALSFGRVARLETVVPPSAVEEAPGEREVTPLPVFEGRSVVLISIDALRADHLGFAGYSREVSPFIDRLAAESIVFTRAYSASPCSSLSIPSLAAGRFMEPVLRAKADLPAWAADRFSAMGYSTIGHYPAKVFSAGPELMGRIEESRFGFSAGGILERREAKADLDAAIETLAGVEGRPVFIWVHLYDPHLPYHCHDAPFGSEPMDCYDAEIRHMDEHLEGFVERIDAVLDRPILALTADHGEAFNEHGRLYHSTDLYEEQVRVPLVIRIPGGEPSVVDAPVSNVDLLGCLEQLAGGPAAGNGVCGQLAGRAPDPGPVFAAVKDKRMVVSGANKMICNGWPDGPCALYDLDRDPGENRNMAGRNPSKAAGLLSLLKEREEKLLAQLGESLPRPIVLGRLGRKDVAPKLVTLAGTGGEGGVEAARLLAMYRDDDMEDALEKLHDSQDPEVAAWACVGSVLLEEDCDPELVARTAKRADGLGAWSAVALGRLGDRRGFERLVEVLRSDDPALRAEAALALGELGEGRAVTHLMKLLDVKQSRWAAIEALAEIGDPRARAKLERLMVDDPDQSNRERYERALEGME